MTSDPMELELQPIVSYPTWVLGAELWSCKYSMYSQPPNHLSGPSVHTLNQPCVYSKIKNLLNHTSIIYQEDTCCTYEKE